MRSSTDDEGRVVGLDLPDNNLTGRIPPGLGGLGELYWLMVGANPLSGPLPLALAGLSLEVFGCADSDRRGRRAAMKPRTPGRSPPA